MGEARDTAPAEFPKRDEADSRFGVGLIDHRTSIALPHRRPRVGAGTLCLLGRLKQYRQLPIERLEPFQEARRARVVGHHPRLNPVFEGLHEPENIRALGGL